MPVSSLITFRTMSPPTVLLVPPAPSNCSWLSEDCWLHPILIAMPLMTGESSGRSSMKYAKPASMLEVCMKSISYWSAMWRTAFVNLRHRQAHELTRASVHMRTGLTKTRGRKIRFSFNFYEFV